MAMIFIAKEMHKAFVGRATAKSNTQLLSYVNTKQVQKRVIILQKGICP